MIQDKTTRTSALYYIIKKEEENNTKELRLQNKNRKLSKPSCHNRKKMINYKSSYSFKRKTRPHNKGINPF